MGKHKKRPPGMGSIVKTGNSYQYSLYHDGKRHYGHAPTKKEAEAELDKLRHDILDGINISDSNMPLIQWLRRWLATYCLDIRASTRTNYECYIRHIESHSIAQIPISKVKADDFQSLANYLYTEGRIDGNGGLSSKTVKSVFNMISSAMSEAMHSSLVRMDSSKFAKLPKLRQNERPTLSPDEVRQLINVSKEFHPSVFIGIYILANCALRSGETLALRQDSLCYKEGIPYLNIQFSLQRVKNFSAKENEPKTQLMLTAPKTENSVRKIPLPPEVAETIQNHINWQKEQAEKSYGLYNHNAFLVSDDLGNMVDPSKFRKDFNKVVAAAKLPRTTTQHVLRHSRCSHLIQMGCSAKMVSLYMGHCDPGFTLRQYAHYRLKELYSELIEHDKKI